MPDGKGLNRANLNNLPLALQRRVVKQFLQKVLPGAPCFEQNEAVTKLIGAPNSTRTSTLPGGGIAEVKGDWIVFCVV